MAVCELFYDTLCRYIKAGYRDAGSIGPGMAMVEPDKSDVQKRS